MSTTTSGRSASAAAIEDATIQQIPEDQRHGTNRDMFTIWFGTNIMILSIVTGALATTVFGLPIWAAALAIVIGNLFGAIFMALHSAQGPTLGVPQMVQTKGQFGAWGSVLIVLVVVCMYLGFFISILVFGGQSLASVIPGLSPNGGIVILALVSLAAAIWGYSLIHTYARVMSLASGIVLILAFIWAFGVHTLPHGFFHSGGSTTAGFMGMVAAGATWQIAYAPYVSDYSRYLPKATGAKPAFWMSYWGTTLGSILPMFLGAGIGALLPTADPVLALTKATSGISVLVVAVFSIGVAATNAMNLYCCSLCTITIGQTFKPKWQPRGGARTVIAIVLVAVALAVALSIGSDFVTVYNDFLTLLLGSLVPWTAVNLVDFYLVRHGDYEVDDFFKADGGRYGRFNWSAVTCYLIGIAVEVPFMVIIGHYTGPIAQQLSGTDISFIAGLVIVCPLYYVTVKIVEGRRAARSLGSPPLVGATIDD